MRVRVAVASLAVLAGAAAVVGPPSVASAAAAPRYLAETGTESAMVHDSATQRTFVGGDRGLAVFAANRRVERVVPMRVTALLVHDDVLYIGSANRVARLDTTSLKLLAPVGATQIGQVDSLAFAGGRVWLSAGDVPGSGRSGVLRSIDPDSGALGPSQAETTGPVLVSSPGRPSALWSLGNTDPFNTGSSVRYTVNGAQARPVASTDAFGIGVLAAAASSDGKTLAVSPVDGQGVVTVNATTLATQKVIALQDGTPAVKLSSAVVNGVSSFAALVTGVPGGTPVQQFAFGATAATRSYGFPPTVTDIALTPTTIYGALTDEFGSTSLAALPTRS